MKTDKPLYQSVTLLAAITATILLIPLLAMSFTSEVDWTLSDFIIAGILLFGTGLTYIAATRKSRAAVYRIAVGLSLATALFLAWANLAVGIIGQESNPINLLYFGVLGVGAIGSLSVRFRPGGMAHTLYATALSQALVTAIALAGGFYQSPPSSTFEILGVNGFFIMLWIASALLFNRAAQHQSEQRAS